MEDRKIAETLEEAYKLRDRAYSEDERDFYQEQVYNLRRNEYRSRGIRTEISSRRREHQSAIEFSREMFFLEVSEISARNAGAEPENDQPHSGQPHSGQPHSGQPHSAVRQAQLQARRYATRLDTHAFLKQLASPHVNAVTLYRRNYLELLRAGKGAEDSYYLARVMGLADERIFRGMMDRIREQGHPGSRASYTVEKTAIQIRDLPGGMILILLTFFVSLFAFVWAANEWGGRSAGEIVFITLGLIAAGGLMLVSAIFIVTFIRSINK